MSVGKGQEIHGNVLDTNKHPYEYHNCCTTRKGYSGTAMFTKMKPMSVQYGIEDETFSVEGRLITLDYPRFFLVNTYVPNAGGACKGIINSYFRKLAQ